MKMICTLLTLTLLSAGAHASFRNEALDSLETLDTRAALKILEVERALGHWDELRARLKATPGSALESLVQVLGFRGECSNEHRDGCDFLTSEQLDIYRSTLDLALELMSDKVLEYQTDLDLHQALRAIYRADWRASSGEAALDYADMATSLDEAMAESAYQLRTRAGYYAAGPWERHLQDLVDANGRVTPESLTALAGAQAAELGIFASKLRLLAADFKKMFGGPEPLPAEGRAVMDPARQIHVMTYARISFRSVADDAPTLKDAGRLPILDPDFVHFLLGHSDQEMVKVRVESPGVLRGYYLRLAARYGACSEWAPNSHVLTYFENPQDPRDQFNCTRADRKVSMSPMGELEHHYRASRPSTANQGLMNVR